jgi:adenylate cyclase
VARISIEELADLAPSSVHHLILLDDLGLLEPGEDGTYAASDVHIVRLMTAFDEAGIWLEDVARGVADGQLVFPPGLTLPEPDTTSITYTELGERIGCSPDLLRRLTAELGLPANADDRIREEDAEILTLMITTLENCEEDELSRVARLYGGSMQRLVTSGIQFFDRAVRKKILAQEIPNDEKDRLVFERAAGFTELMTDLVPWLQRRHREHVVLEYIVTETEEAMEDRGVTPRLPRQQPAIAFLDLTGYTALAEERGDEAAAEVAAELASVVQETALAHGGRAIKWLGDGVMFHFGDPARAIRSGLDLVERTERALSVPARIGINAGAVVAQEGDYFGRTVNIASRIADYASPREVLVSDEAKRSASVSGVVFELVGDVSLKGVSGPVRLHRAIRDERPLGAVDEPTFPFPQGASR